MADPANTSADVPSSSVTRSKTTLELQKEELRKLQVELNDKQAAKLERDLGPTVARPSSISDPSAGTSRRSSTTAPEPPAPSLDPDLAKATSSDSKPKDKQNRDATKQHVAGAESLSPAATDLVRAAAQKDNVKEVDKQQALHAENEVTLIA